MNQKTRLAVVFAIVAAPIIYQIPDAINAQIESDKREYAALTADLKSLIGSYSNFAHAALTTAAGLRPDEFTASKAITYKTAAGQSETATLKFNSYSVVRSSGGDRVCAEYSLFKDNIPKTIADINELQSELAANHYPYRNIMAKSDIAYAPSMWTNGGTVCLPK